MTQFSNLLIRYMGRINASENWLGNKIGLKGAQTINNWKNGKFMPNKHHRERLLLCAKTLLLNEEETNQFLEAAGFSKEYVLGENLSDVIFASFIRALFTKLAQLNPYPVMLLLTQAHWGEPPLREALLRQAKTVYSANKVFHIQPPYSLSADEKEYFTALGQQCGFKEVRDDYDFERALQERLKEAEDPWFLLVSRFEQGLPTLRKQLAGLLRSLSDRYLHRLHVIFCGAEQLAALKYQQGDMSLLTTAMTQHWPELGPAEVYALRDHRFKRVSLDAPLVEELLSVSGAHPQLLNDCLTLRQQEPDLPLTAYPDRLSQSQSVWAAFVPYTQDHRLRQQVSHWLQRSPLTRAQPFILDPLLRQLYWRNLLAVRDIQGESYLCWRCAALQRGGQHILEEAHESM